MRVVNTREIAQEYRLTHWAGVMRERVDSGLSIKAFCRQIGICGNTYYYWQRRLREAAYEQMEAISRTESKSENLPTASFTEVVIKEPVTKPNAIVPEQSGQIRIEINGLQMAADSDYPTEKLVQILLELSRSC